MRRPDQETFDRDVTHIREKYGGSLKREDPTSVYFELFRYSREPVEGKRSPGRELGLVGLIGLSAVDLAARGYPVRRRDAAGGTACDVVGKAFFKSYKIVEGVWDERIREPSLPENPKRPPR